MRIGAPDLAPTGIAPAVRDFLTSPKMLIGGASCDGGAAGFDVFNPADGSVLASVPEASEADVARAVQAAQAAMAGPWSAMSGAARAGLMLRLAELLEENGEELAQLETLENGKSIMMSRLIEVASSAEYLRYMAGWATKIGARRWTCRLPSRRARNTPPSPARSRSAWSPQSRPGTFR